MKRLLFVLFLIAAFSLGCLQEKKLDATGAITAFPTVKPSTISLPSALPSLTPSISPSPKPSASASATPSPSPSPSASLQPGNCELHTPREVTEFQPGESVSLLVTFSNLPQSVSIASVKCSDDDTPKTPDVQRSGSSVFAKFTCTYNPSSSKVYDVSVDASGTKCDRVIRVTVS